MDDTFYVMCNASHEPIEFTLPEAKWGGQWSVLLETVDSGDVLDEERPGNELEAGGKLRVESWSLIVLRRTA